MSGNVQREIYPVLFAVIFSVMLARAADHRAFVGGLSYLDLAKVACSTVLIIVLPMLYFAFAYGRIIRRGVSWSLWRARETLIYGGPIYGLYALWLLLAQQCDWGKPSVKEGDWRMWAISFVVTGAAPLFWLLKATKQGNQSSGRPTIVNGWMLASITPRRYMNT